MHLLSSTHFLYIILCILFYGLTNKYCYNLYYFSVNIIHSVNIIQNNIQLFWKAYILDPQN